MIDAGSSRGPEIGRRRGAAAGRLLALMIGAGSLLVVPSMQAQEPDFAKPDRHFPVEQPADLDDAVALTLYSEIIDDLVRGYALSQDPVATAYRKWRRYNWAPYRSANHGERFVNNYANPIAEAYGDFGEAGPARFPVGSIVAKDSFAVTTSGDVFPGALFVMEKMPEGFDPPARDWRYSMIMPDGSYFGISKGDSAERVEFCNTCHQTAGDEADHLFYVPEGNRFRAFRQDQPTGRR